VNREEFRTQLVEHILPVQNREWSLRNAGAGNGEVSTSIVHFDRACAAAGPNQLRLDEYVYASA